MIAIVSGAHIVLKYELTRLLHPLHDLLLPHTVIPASNLPL